jgi:hypothetical protein
VLNDLPNFDKIERNVAPGDNYYPDSALIESTASGISVSQEKEDQLRTGLQRIGRPSRW